VNLAIMTAALAVNVGGCVTCQRANRWQCAFEWIITPVFMANALLFPLASALLTSGDSLLAAGYRIGTMVMLMQYIFAPFMRAPAYLLFAVSCMASAMLSIYVAEQRLMGMADLGSFLSFHVFQMLSSLPNSQVMQRWLRSLYKLQQMLVLEKDAFEGFMLLASDASFWLAADADRISWSDVRLDSLMGKPLQNERLSRCIAQTEQEQQKLADALEKLRQDSEPCLPAPIHTTLVTRRMGEQKVELLVVDRRTAAKARAAGDPGADLAIFVVVRTAEALEFAPGAGLAPDFSDQPSNNAQPGQADEASSSHSSGRSSGRSQTMFARAPAPEVEDAIIEFDPLSQRFDMRKCELTFARQVPGGEPPQLAAFLRQPGSQRFMDWTREQLNAMFQENEHASVIAVPMEEEAGPIQLRVPGGSGTMLEAAHGFLEVTMDNVTDHDEPGASATLRLQQMTRLQPHSVRRGSSVRKQGKPTVGMGTIPEAKKERIGKGTDGSSSSSGEKEGAQEGQAAAASPPAHAAKQGSPEPPQASAPGRRCNACDSWEHRVQVSL